MNIKTIDKEYTYTFIDKKSKFIAIILPCDNKKIAEEILEKMHDKYNDATHICYAYIINDENIIYKSSDDGEPSGTAGAPILNVLKKNNLSNVILCVVRYFGGIKLGAGGLTRAYTNSASGVLSDINIVNIVEAYKFDITFSYENKAIVDKIVDNEDYIILDKQYDIEVIYTIMVYQMEKYDYLNNKIGYLNVKFTSPMMINTRKAID